MLLLQEITQIIEQNVSCEPNDKTLATPNSENKASRTRRRKLVSKVWEDFTKDIGEDGKEKATCKHCRKKLVGSSKSGTSHLKNHLQRCPGKKHKEKSTIDRELNKLNMARMIFNDGVTSIKFLKTDILHVYKEEKEKLRTYLDQLSCRFSLSINRVMNHFDEYICLMVHFIDDNWELKKKILSFKYRYEWNDNFFVTLKSLLSDWSIDKNICSIVAHENDYNHSFEGSVPFAGELFHVRCLSSFLDGILNDIILFVSLRDPVRDCFDYVRKTPENEHKFQIAVDKAISKGKKVTSHCVPTPWLCDFKLLEWTMGAKEAFSELEKIDPDFESINLVEYNWDTATNMFEFLKELYDVARGLSACQHATMNMYFSDVCNMFLKLLEFRKSGNRDVSPIAGISVAVFIEAYWRKYSLFLATAAVLDPRLKLDIVKLHYKEIYDSEGESHLLKIIDEINDVYNEYAKGPSTSSSSNQSTASELDRYLKDPVISLVEEFDILAWWRLNAPNFPTLARMARDFLPIPISTSVLEDEVYKIIYSRDLDSDMKEALMCSKSW